MYTSSLVYAGNGRYCSNFHKDIGPFRIMPLLYCVSFTTQTVALADM